MAIKFYEIMICVLNQKETKISWNQWNTIDPNMQQWKKKIEGNVLDI